MYVNGDGVHERQNLAELHVYFSVISKVMVNQTIPSKIIMVKLCHTLQLT